MKKLLSLMVAICLCCSWAFAGTALSEPAAEGAAQAIPLPSAWPEGTAHQIEKTTYPFYLESLDVQWPEEFPLYFLDGVEDIPYVELRDFAQILEWFYPQSEDGLWPEYSLTVDVNEETRMVSYERENGYSVIFNFDNGRIVWPDHLGFHSGATGFHIDMMGHSGFDDQGRPYLLSRGAARERAGILSMIDLKEYGIPMVAQDDLWLLPMQTLSSFFLSQDYRALLFNQKCLIFASPMDMQQDVFGLLPEVTERVKERQEELGRELTTDEQREIFLELMEEQKTKPSLPNLYRDADRGSRSPSLCDYGFRELCMDLDCLYGLKDAHHIDSFMNFFLETGLAEDLMSPDPNVADLAMSYFAASWMDDGHTSVYVPSYLAEDLTNVTYSGFTATSMVGIMTSLSEARSAHPESSQGYYEVGDTAFVTFNSFSLTDDADYYDAFDRDELPDDTIALIIKAHQQIRREDSPIRNVVIDLSLNGGGAVPAALYVLGWCLGDAPMSIRHQFSGAETTAIYRADVNLDRQFDESDTISDLNVFCVTSPMSFSCGNLVPWAFKEDGRVKLLGSMTGGGSCAILPLTTAWGTCFNISGPYRISFLKNGAYYDVDQGVEPDVVIIHPEHYCDREALAEFVRSLY